MTVENRDGMFVSCVLGWEKARSNFVHSCVRFVMMIPVMVGSINRFDVISEFVTATSLTLLSVGHPSHEFEFAMNICILEGFMNEK